MEKNVWYFMIVDGLMKAIEEIKAQFPCFVGVETVEMNWIELTITARTEDFGAIEKKLAPYA